MSQFHKRPITFFIPALNGGGAQRVVVNLANALIDLTDHPIHIVLVRREGVFLRDLRAEVTVKELKCSRTILAIPRLARYLRSERPAVIMSSMNYVNIYAVVAHLLAGRPCRLVLREATMLAPKGAVKGLGLRLRMVLTWATYRFSSAIVANSKDTLESLTRAKISLPPNCQVIGNPIALPAPRLKERREIYKGPKNVPFICAAGRLVPLKGFDVLISALAVCSQSNLHLVILGEGPLRSELEKQVLELGLRERVHFPGFINPPSAVILNAQAFVLPSRWEGFGNVIVEALALGTPVVATDCPGGPKEILAGGKYGHLVPVDDIEALAAAITQVVQNPISNATQRRQRAECYTPQYIARMYLDRALLPTEIHT